MQSGSKAHVSLTPYHRSLWYACCPHSALYSLTQLRKVTQSSALGVTLEYRTGKRRHSSSKSACLAPHQRDVIFAEISRVNATESFLTRTHSNAPTIWLLTAPFSLETPKSQIERTPDFSRSVIHQLLAFADNDVMARTLKRRSDVGSQPRPASTNTNTNRSLTAKRPLPRLLRWLAANPTPTLLL